LKILSVTRFKDPKAEILILENYTGGSRRRRVSVDIFKISTESDFKEANKKFIIIWCEKLLNDI
jgi:hypothetical protein